MGSCISSLHSICTNNLLQGNCLRQNSMGVPVYSCRQNRCVSTVHTFLVNNQVIHVVMFALRHFLGLINLFLFLQFSFLFLSSCPGFPSFSSLIFYHSFTLHLQAERYTSSFFSVSSCMLMLLIGLLLSLLTF